MIKNRLNADLIGWDTKFTKKGDRYYLKNTKSLQWENPLDQKYRQLFISEKLRKIKPIKYRKTTFTISKIPEEGINFDEVLNLTDSDCNTHNSLPPL